MRVESGRGERREEGGGGKEGVSVWRVRGEGLELAW